ncbi:E3 ubiquitin-protein ligase RNF25 [Pelobates fuscus]|uniref:E3 ubiquitin-protein ligase RNF25 n=1 Tax=Pelobates fuscus TaxID=191477 RepID=UPI002FE4B26E
MAEGGGEGTFLQELQVLESIYLDELQITRGERLVLCITLHPATGHDTDSQYVRFTLQLSLPPQYPEEPPDISISNPRGLCDQQIRSIIRSLNKLAVQQVGYPILYELIEKGKEMLTNSNIPHGHCSICLYDFQEGDSLTKTPCFHHFHSHCLGQYADHCKKNSNEQEPLVLCPVCRENLTCDFHKLKTAPPPQHPEVLYVPDTDTLQKTKELRQVYEKQLLKGGIIDLETEKKRFFISIQDLPNDDLLVAQTEGVGPVQTEEDLVVPVPHKPQRFSGHSGQKPGMRNRPIYREQHSMRHFQAGRDWMWQSRSRSETNTSQCASRTVGREGTRLTLSREQITAASERSKHPGPRTFRTPHQGNRENNI